ncbi:CRISPR type I-D/CYANO-associated protein Csc1 [Thermoplasmatales archaeon]|nr:CRISPR type I-D/CYANO-associated protein Csc1 [Thermoplasmatales archaeon]
MKNLRLKPIRIETISPVNYYYIPAAGGMRTSDFIGDIALKYAALHQLGKMDYFYPTKFQPTYEELLEFPFWFTVAINEKMAFGGERDTIYMKNMVRNTMQGIDYNGTSSYPGFGEGSKMYKNFYFQQPIKPGNIFYTYLITTEDDFELPRVLRVGNNKTGLLKLQDYHGSEFRAVINAYTIQNIMGKSIPKFNYEYASHSVLQYFLLGMLSIQDLLKIYGG